MRRLSDESRLSLALFGVGWGANQFTPLLVVYRTRFGLRRRCSGALWLLRPGPHPRAARRRPPLRRPGAQAGGAALPGLLAPGDRDPHRRDHLGAGAGDRPGDCRRRLRRRLRRWLGMAPGDVPHAQSEAGRARGHRRVCLGPLVAGSSPTSCPGRRSSPTCLTCSSWPWRCRERSPPARPRAPERAASASRRRRGSSAVPSPHRPPGTLRLRQRGGHAGGAPHSVPVAAAPRRGGGSDDRDHPRSGSLHPAARTSSRGNRARTGRAGRPGLGRRRLGARGMDCCLAERSGGGPDHAADGRRVRAVPGRRDGGGGPDGLRRHPRHAGGLVLRLGLRRLRGAVPGVLGGASGGSSPGPPGGKRGGGPRAPRPPISVRCPRPFRPGGALPSARRSITTG